LGEEGDDLFRLDWQGTFQGWHDGNKVHIGSISEEEIRKHNGKQRVYQVEP